jgi:hypothetical protein
MQLIIDQLSTPALFGQTVEEFLNVARCAEKSSVHLLGLKRDFEHLSTINIGNNVQQNNQLWLLTISTLRKVQNILKSLIKFSPPPRSKITGRFR